MHISSAGQRDHDFEAAARQIARGHISAQPLNIALYDPKPQSLVTSCKAGIRAIPEAHIAFKNMRQLARTHTRALIEDASVWHREPAAGGVR